MEIRGVVEGTEIGRGECVSAVGLLNILLLCQIARQQLGPRRHLQLNGSPGTYPTERLREELKRRWLGDEGRRDLGACQGDDYKRVEACLG